LETAQLEVAAKEVEKMRQLLSDVFDEMHLLFAPPYSPQNPKGVGEETPGPVGQSPDARSRDNPDFNISS
jgi:hypothetical protein